MFKQNLKKTIFAIIVCIILCGLMFGCSKVDGDNIQTPTNTDSGQTPMPLASIPAPMVLPTGEPVIAEVRFTEVDPPEIPSVSGGAYQLPESIEDLFAVTSIVAFGEVVNVREYELEVVMDSGYTTTLYFSGIEFKVLKSYGGDSNLDNQTIQVYYEPCAHRDFGERYPDIEVGNRYFFFLYNTVRHFSKPEYIELVEEFPYSLTPSMESISEQIENGYNGAFLDALIVGNYSPYDSESRLVKVCTFEHIENIINNNIDNMRGLTLVEFQLEKMGFNN